MKTHRNLVTTYLGQTALALLLPSLMLLAGGCDNSMNPLNEKKGIYSIYGYLDILDEVNYIRVKDMNIPLVADTTETIDATVTLTNMETGESQVLQDSVVQFDSVMTHNFRTTMDIRPRTTYRVEVEGSDGRSVSATATTPGIAQTNVAPTGEICAVPITITFDNVQPRTAVSMEIHFVYKKVPYFMSRILRPEEQIDYDGSVSFTARPHQIIREGYCRKMPDSICEFPALPPGACFMLSSDVFTVDYIHYGPGYEFNDESNVSDSLSIPGGAGKLIGLLKDSFSFKIDTSYLYEDDLIDLME